MSEALKQNWARAKTLAENTGISPAATRSYLSKNKGKYEDYLDSIQKGETNWDGRNPICKELTQELEGLEGLPTPTPKHRRTSQGDPTRTVRAGAPRRHVSIEQLFVLKDLVNDLGGLQSTQKALDFLVQFEAIN